MRPYLLELLQRKKSMNLTNIHESILKNGMAILQINDKFSKIVHECIYLWKNFLKSEEVYKYLFDSYSHFGFIPSSEESLIYSSSENDNYSIENPYKKSAYFNFSYKSLNNLI